MELESSIIHVNLKCTECDWKTGDHITGLPDAQAHSRRTGHTVRGETASYVEITSEKERK